MNKLKFILTAGIAATLTISCSTVDDILNGDSSSSSKVSTTTPSSSSGRNNSSSSSGGSSPSGGGTTETFTLVEREDLYFKYKGGNAYESCEGGNIIEHPYEKLVFYSIKNNVLDWTWTYDGYEGLEIGDTLNLKGTSNNLTGTWTRTKNKDASCELNTEFDSPFYSCKEGYDITKAVFNATNVVITRDECLTVSWVNGSVDYQGWKTKVVDCNTLEFSKGSDKITRKLTKTGEEMIYNGSSCKDIQPNKSQKELACATAWAQYSRAIAEGEDDSSLDYYYYNNISNDEYYPCLRELLPEDWWGDEGGD
ncbi:MAG: hypothetical protein FWF63_01530 [Fibromonadales bacterium]|nr:hypothetical protein [Fibromonadales bacterium]